MNRGDIVLARVPYVTGDASKNRPVLIVQADALRSRVVHTVVAAISSNVNRAAHPECCLINASHSDWGISGLRLDSVVRCDRLFTIDQSSMIRVLGSLSNATMNQINGCLKAALAIS